MGRIDGDELKAEVAFPRCISADGMRRMSQAFVLPREQCRVALREKKIPTGLIHQLDRPLSQPESACEGGKAPHLISFRHLALRTQCSHSALSSRSAHSESARDLIIYWSNSLSIPSSPAQHPVSDPPQLQHPPSLSALYDHHPTPPISHFPPHNAAPTAAYAFPTRDLLSHEHE